MLKAVCREENTFMGWTLYFTQPLMTLILNNECGENSPLKRPSVIIFIRVQEREELGPNTLSSATPRLWWALTVSRPAVLCLLLLRRRQHAGVNMHSQWLLGSSRPLWCSASWLSPPGRRWGWAQRRWAATLSLLWISSSSSWRSLQDNKWKNITAECHKWRFTSGSDVMGCD